MFLWFVSLALAGTIQVHSPGPVTYILDGKVVGKLVTDVTLTDVPEGAHSLRVEDTFGAAVASTDFVLGSTPILFELEGRRLFVVDQTVDRPDGPKPPITDNQFDRLQHKLVRKRSDEKKLKKLAAMAPNYWFEMRHIDKILLGFGTIEDRVQASKILAPRTIDPEKTRAIQDQFPPGDYRERALAEFRRYQRPDAEEE